MTGFPIRKDRHSRRRAQCDDEAKIGEMQLEATDCQGSLATPEARERHGRVLCRIAGVWLC